MTRTMLPKLKRYRLDADPDDPEARMVRDPDGEWLKLRDVQRLLADIPAATGAAMSALLRAAIENRTK